MARSYIVHVVIAALLVGGGIAAKTLSIYGLAPAWLADSGVYVVGSVAALLWLFLAAIRLRRYGVEGFDMIVASETIIAFGILSLVIGLVLALNYATLRAGDISEIDMDSIRPLTIPFLEGLVAAGIAPLLATILRQYEALAYAGEGAYGAGAAGSGEGGFFERLERIEKSLDRAVTSAERLSQTFEEGANRVESSVAKLGAATEGLGESLRRETQQVADAASGSQQELIALRDRASESQEALGQLAREAEAFRKAAAEGTTLLTGLAQLIESVERFIKPENRRDGS